MFGKQNRCSIQGKVKRFFDLGIVSGRPKKWIDLGTDPQHKSQCTSSSNWQWLRAIVPFTAIDPVLGTAVRLLPQELPVAQSKKVHGEASVLDGKMVSCTWKKPVLKACSVPPTYKPTRTNTLVSSVSDSLSNLCLTGSAAVIFAGHWDCCPACGEANRWVWPKFPGPVPLQEFKLEVQPWTDQHHARLSLMVCWDILHCSKATPAVAF